MAELELGVSLFCVRHGRVNAILYNNNNKTDCLNM